MNRDDWLSQNTASTTPIIELPDRGDINITRRTPITSPGILDNKSFKKTHLLIPNSQDSMINIRATTRTNHTRTRELEDVLISFDKNRDRVIDQSRFQLISAFRNDIPNI